MYLLVQYSCFVCVVSWLYLSVVRFVGMLGVLKIILNFFKSIIILVYGDRWTVRDNLWSQYCGGWLLLKISIAILLLTYKLVRAIAKYTAIHSISHEETISPKSTLTLS